MNKTQKIVLFSIIGVVLTGLITALIIRISRKKRKRGREWFQLYKGDI